MHFPDTFIWLGIEMCYDTMADDFQVEGTRCGRVLKVNASGAHPALRQHFATVTCEICESHFALQHAKAIEGQYDVVVGLVVGGIVLFTSAVRYVILLPK